MKRFALILPMLLLASPVMAAEQDALASSMNAAFQASAIATGNLENAARVAMQQRAQLQAMLVRAVELCGDRCAELTTPKVAEPTGTVPAPVEVKPEVAAPAK